ncbi:MAG: hypothetical protein WC560_05190, partial [Syntrophales bacterium]
WYSYEVHMITHQAPTENCHPKTSRFLLNKLQVVLPIIIALKYIHGADAPLRNVVRIADCYNP